MSELKHCPFCSAEPEILSDGRRTWGLVQHNDGCLFPTYPKHEIPESDFAAWNTRAAMEFDNWFYLPKPKEPIVEVTETTHAWDGTKVKTDVFYQVREQAAINWAKELDEHIIKRICEVWNPERTCHIEYPHYGDAPVINGQPRCSECKTEFAVGTFPHYCPNCGAKVVE